MKEKLIRVAPILLIIAIAILAIALIVSLGRMLIGNSEGGEFQTSSEVVKDESSLELVKTEDGRSVRMTVRGPIVAQEDARSYIVEVSPNHRSLKTYKGYSKEIIDNVELPNSHVSYSEFVNALNLANMMKGKELTGESDNLLGICATGHVYDFAILKDGEQIKHLWTSTCSGSKGSLFANTKQLQGLFINQIPDHEKVVRDLGLSNL